MATEEWKKEVQKHEQYIKDLEEKFKTKCEEMQVVNLDNTEKTLNLIFLKTLKMPSVCIQLRDRPKNNIELRETKLSFLWGQSFKIACVAACTYRRLFTGECH